MRFFRAKMWSNRSANQSVSLHTPSLSLNTRIKVCYDQQVSKHLLCEVLVGALEMITNEKDRSLIEVDLRDHFTN